MWRHQAGRIDFDGPLLELLQGGWGFGESAPIDGGRGGGCWAVVGVHDGERVQGDRPERREAWAEAVRLALRAAAARGPYPEALLSGALGGPPDDPTACDEERARLRDAGWSFSEHPTAQASGREGWVVSGTRARQRIRAVNDDRSDAWGEALILAAMAGMEASGGPGPGRPLPDHVG